MSPFVQCPFARPTDEFCRGMLDSPVIASIGTVLIDAFDGLPRPVMESSSPEPSRPLSPIPTHSPTLPMTKPLFIPPARLDISPPLSSPGTSGTSCPSGPSTPQLLFDDMPALNVDAVYEMLGGGALYALVGARFWLPPYKLKTLIDRAPPERDDCPKEVENRLNKLGSEIWVWNRNENTRMTRARIRYEGDARYFQSVVKPPYRTMAEISASPLGKAEYLHISPPYSPEDVATLLTERETLSNEWRPKIVYEPAPTACHPQQKDWLEKILPDIQVLSPNHEELFSFYGISPMPISSPALRPTVESLINYLLHHVGIGPDGQGIIVIRCGRLGACLGTKSGGLVWCPAYFDGKLSKRVKDVTGAGNSFLGGFMAGLSLTNDPYEALLYGTVSSSFVVEQFGIPFLMDCADPVTGEEIWNADTPSRRLNELRKRHTHHG
ncbi:hypothetical protein L204_105871 [Cryptococcus depauperatus]